MRNTSSGTGDESYIELYDPEQRDEQEVKGDEEAEGPPHVGDALLLAGFVWADALSHGRTVDRPRPPAGQPRFCAAAASAVHPGVGPAHWRAQGRTLVESQVGGSLGEVTPTQWLEGILISVSAEEDEETPPSAGLMTKLD